MILPDAANDSLGCGFIRSRDLFGELTTGCPEPVAYDLAKVTPVDEAEARIWKCLVRREAVVYWWTNEVP